MSKGHDEKKLSDKKTFFEKMKENIKNNNFVKNYSRMWPFVKPYWGRALLAVAICIPIGCLDAVIAWSLKPYMDVVLVAKEKSFYVTWGVPIAIILFTTIQGICNYLATYLNAWVGQKITIDLKKTLFTKLLNFETSYFDTHTSGEIVYRFNQDADIACNGLLANLKLFVSRFFASVSLLIVLLINSWELFIVATIILGIALAPLAFIRKRIEAVVGKNVAGMTKIVTTYN